MTPSSSERPVLLVVFGAGASHDSLPRHPTSPTVQAARNVRSWRPPLATQLFDLEDEGYAGIAQQFPEAIGRINQANAIAANGGAIEETLEDWQTEAESNPRRFRQLAFMRFYLQELLWTCSREWLGAAFRRTNYLLLTDALEDWRQNLEAEIAYATFNYDLLLEDALPDLSLPTVRDTVERGSLRGYVADPDTKVFKLHGSVNWGHPIANTDASAGGLDDDPRIGIARESSDLTVEKAIRVLGDPTWPVYDQQQLMFPALAIPVVTKRVFECPDDHLSRLIQMVGRVRWILLIGWRGTEQHFLDILHHHLPRGGPPIRLHNVGRDEVRSQAVTEAIEMRLTDAAKDRYFDASTSAGGFGKWLARDDMPYLVFGRDVLSR